ncbi:MAG: isopentenyl-diphosphate Delta-isomerase [Phycisphaerales bacterium]|nr:isopentenyl-diphosphate Delta-isomerase [Hyphomonadaceae bacterium]
MRLESLLGRRLSKARATAAHRADEIVIPAIAADGTLYPMEKMQAHRQGALHLAISVFVMDGDALLMQRRALTKYHCGGLWANTCCSHPSWGETPEASARRRLREELGLSLDLDARNVIDYEAEVTNGLRECERVHVFRGEADRNTILLSPDPDEVSDARWVSLPVLRSDVADRPGAYAPWFRIYLNRWDELGL